MRKLKPVIVKNLEVGYDYRAKHNHPEYNFFIWDLVVAKS